MPILNCQKDNKPGYKYGPNGFCYTYIKGDEKSQENAKKKAWKQGVAEIVSKMMGKTISFDYDGTLSTKKGKELALKFIEDNDSVLILTARQSDDDNTDLYSTAEKLGINKNDIYFTNGKDKWSFVEKLGIDEHYDNNQEQVDKINANTASKGILFTN